MTVRTQSALKTRVAQLLGDNTSGDITPADVRSILVDVVDTLFDVVPEEEDTTNDDTSLSDYQLIENALQFSDILGPLDLTPSTRVFASTGFTGWADKTIILFTRGEAPTTSLTTELPDYRGNFVFVADLLDKDAASVGDSVELNPYSNSLRLIFGEARRTGDDQYLYVGRTLGGQLLIAPHNIAAGYEKMRITAL